MQMDISPAKPKFAPDRLKFAFDDSFFGLCFTKHVRDKCLCIWNVQI